jgi:hypothetical protein
MVSGQVHGRLCCGCKRCELGGSRDVSVSWLDARELLRNAELEFKRVHQCARLFDRRV